MNECGQHVEKAEALPTGQIILSHEEYEKIYQYGVEKGLFKPFRADENDPAVAAFEDLENPFTIHDDGAYGVTYADGSAQGRRLDHAEGRAWASKYDKNGDGIVQFSELHGQDLVDFASRFEAKTSA